MAKTSKKKKAAGSGGFTAFLGTKKGKRISLIVVLLVFAAIGTYIFAHSYAASGYYAVRNDANSDATVAVRRGSGYPVYYVSASKLRLFSSNENGNYVIRQFYVHACMDVAVSGSWGTNTYTSTGWHTFPSAFINDYDEAALYEYRDGSTCE